MLMGIQLHASFQALAAVYLMPSLFQHFSQRILVVVYRRFGTNYLSYLQGSNEEKTHVFACENGISELRQQVTTITEEFPFGLPGR